jgi:hypothetical protein
LPLSQSKLADELAKMEPVDNEAAAIVNLANAWEIYFSEASVSGVPTAPETLGGAMLAFKGALVGMNVPGAAIIKLPAALSAFWVAVQAAAGTIWPLSAPSFPPPTLLTTLVPDLLSAFASNLASNADLRTAASDIARVLHNNAGLGGTVIVGSPPPVPIV